MKISTCEAEWTELSDDTLSALRTRHRGPILESGMPGFEEASSIWNGMIDRAPALVARCRGTADVIEAVRFAREHDLLLGIRGGGHNIAGLAIPEEGMMLDLSLMRGVHVDPVNRIASAQGGCELGDVDRETQVHGLATVLGFVSQTGIAGLTLGGGFGYLTRRFGWTADNLVGMDVVTADGEFVRASSSENKDLFWALRGGGGNFGVVTRFDYQLHELGPEIVGGPIAWSGDDAGDVLEFYREIAESAPRELTLVAFIRKAPPAPWIPAEWHGRMIIGVIACYSGDPAEGERLLAPLKNFRDPIADLVARRPYVQLQSMLDATQPVGRRYYWKSDYLSGIDDEFIVKGVDWARQAPSMHDTVFLFQLGGALNDLPADHSPAGNRAAKYIFNIAGGWDDSTEDAVNVAWARGTWEDLRKHSSVGTYLNFLTEDDEASRTETALAGSLERLRGIKTEWDPDNFFRVNRNVKPG